MNIETREKLAELVRNLRGNKSQRAFAKQIGVSLGALQSWENSETYPGTENLTRIAALAGYSLNELITYLEDREPEEPADTNRVVRQIQSMRPKELAIVIRAIGDRLANSAEGK